MIEFFFIWVDTAFQLGRFECKVEVPYPPGLSERNRKRDRKGDNSVS